MKHLIRAACIAAIAAPAFCADMVITKSKHTDAVKMMGQETAARDSTEVTWVGKQKLRHEEGDRVTIVRTDLKKMYLLDTSAKTYTTLDLPFDLMKQVPAEMAPMMESMFAGMKVTVTPTTETKKVKDWNATKYTVEMTMPMGAVKKEVWATKDVAFDKANHHELMSAMLSLLPGGAAMAAEWGKIDGFPVLVEGTQSMMGNEVKSTESVTSVETKDAAEGLYDLPKDFTEKPFDFMAEMQRRSPGGKSGAAPKKLPPSGH